MLATPGSEPPFEAELAAGQQAPEPVLSAGLSASGVRRPKLVRAPSGATMRT